MQKTKRLSFLGCLSFLLVLVLSPAAAAAQDNPPAEEPVTTQVVAGAEEGPPPEVASSQQEIVPVADNAPAEASIPGGPEIPGEPAIPEEPAAEWGNTIFPLMKVAGGIGIVIGLILGGFWAMKKVAPQYFAKRGAGKMLRLIETLSMGEKRTIAIVEVAGKSYLIGNTPGQISLLDALQHLPEACAARETRAGADLPAGNGSRKGSFLDIYEAARSTPAQAARPAQIPPDIRGKMRELRQALEK